METCSENVMATGMWCVNRVCGKPAKGVNSAGKPVCGLHLAAERKRLARNEAVDKKLAEDRAWLEKTHDLLAEHKIHGYPDPRVRRILLTEEELLKLLGETND